MTPLPSHPARFRLRAFALIALLAVAGAGPLGAARAPRNAPESAKASTNSTAPAIPLADFNAFRLVTERNIFNPNRIGRTRESNDAPPPRVETIAFVGTMETDRGLRAFFDSTDAAFKKTLREGETVADFTVKRILSDSVELTRGEQTTPLRMTQQLRRTEGGEWTVTVREQVRPEVAKAAEAAAPLAIPSNASEVLRRLMEQRQKALKQ